MKMELSNFILQMDTLLLDSKIIKKENDIQEENDIHEKDKSKNIALLQQSTSKNIPGIDQYVQVDRLTQRPDNNDALSQFSGVINKIHDKIKIEADFVDSDDMLKSSIVLENNFIKLDSAYYNVRLCDKKFSIKCRICNVSFFGKPKLRIHMRYHSLKLPLSKKLLMNHTKDLKKHYNQILIK